MKESKEVEMFNGFYRDNGILMFKQGQFHFSLKINATFDGTKFILMEFTDDCPLNIYGLHVCNIAKETEEITNEHLVIALDVLNKVIKKYQGQLKNLLLVTNATKKNLKKQIACKGIV